ncbi:ankyrin repeat domain-containing protein [Ottowia thiooxydans]
MFRLNEVNHFSGATPQIGPREYEYFGKPLDEAMRQAVLESDVDTLQAIRQQYPAPFSSQLSKLFSVDSGQRTFLMLAVELGDRKMVDYLLTLGAQVEQRDDYGRTALMIAAQKGNQEVVESLLKVEGIDIDGCDRKGTPALVYAAAADQTDIVDLLLRHRAGALKPYLIFDALYMAVSRKNLEMARLLNAVLPFDALVPRRD